MMKARLLALAVMAGCGGASLHGPGPLRFRNAPPVTLVNDRTPTAKPPTFDQGLVEYYVRNDLIQPTRRLLTISDHRAAENVNSFGEVPDSAWFTNRNPTPEEIERGPGAGGPDRSSPWKVIGVKVGGAAIGITIKDVRGDTYVLKFDERGHAETESAADVIVQRLTWAMGYNVPDNQVVNFKREQLVLDPEAKITMRSGKKRPMTEAELETYLGMGESEHGSFRGLVSRFIDGKILGGVEPEGTRKDDPNDRVRHELRRDLRGQRLLWAWVNHIDIKSQNALATYTSGKYVKWYVLDFGESLGVGARTTHVERLGYRTTYSLGEFFTSLVTFGMVVQPYERAASYPDYRGLGHFDAANFDPGAWVPNHNWRPTDVADKVDELWAAEKLMRLTRAHIAAAVAAGKYTDARTSDYMISTLLARQRKLGAYAFSRLAPLTALEAHERSGRIELCFDDLWLRYLFGAPGETHYRAVAFDYDGRALADKVAPALATGAHSCVAGIPAAAAHEGYTIVELRVQRGEHGMAPLYVHVAKADGGLRVVGLDRR